jgi:hypothetical protein
MGAFFSAIIAKIVGFSEWIGRLFVAVFVAIWDFIRDAATWPFEQIMEIVQSAAESIDVSGVSGSVGVWGQLPGEVLNVLGVLGVGTAIGIISAAILIRLGLQLIPFTRLGS